MILCTVAQNNKVYIIVILIIFIFFRMTSQIVEAHREVMNLVTNKEKKTIAQMTETFKTVGNLLGEILDSKEHKSKMQR